jgi:hypothetical protein
MKSLTRYDSETMLKMMCRYANIEYEDVDWTDREWFNQHNWTKVQQEQFIEWLTVFLFNKHYARTMKIARHEAEKLNMQYGWTTKT